MTFYICCYIRLFVKKFYLLYNNNARCIWGAQPIFDQSVKIGPVLVNIFSSPRIILFHGGPAPVVGRTKIFLHDLPKMRFSGQFLRIFLHDCLKCPCLPFFVNIFAQLRIMSLAVQTRVWQLDRWPCHSLTHWVADWPTFLFWNNWVTLWIYDLWDIWSEWWGNLTKKRQWQNQIHRQWQRHLENTFK